ncbi:MAG: YkgJ family cysteine cluster protein [Desulfobacterales bacterium]|nr:YkgJ family cysteine cluster protein [Desulfobacterales bacterium]
MEFVDLFEKYEMLVQFVDTIFEKMARDYPEQVKCTQKCADCCHALFDLTLIEAIYINHQFQQHCDNTKKTEILSRADTSDRLIYQIKREAYQKSQQGIEEREIVEQIGQERVRCPLLNDKELCEFYNFRPITCRLYGIPTAIGGAGHTCGFSGFEKGETYPTVNMDGIYSQLYALSKLLVDSIQTKYDQMSDILMPVSMALLTEFTPEYLGIIHPENKGENQ